MDGTKVAATGSGITIASNSFTGETWAPAAADIVGKQFYFPNTGNRYPIVAYDTGSRLVTISGNFLAGDATSSSNGGRVLDSNATGYKVKFTRYDGTNSDMNNQQYIVELDTSYVTDPSFMSKVELNKQWFMAIRGTNPDNQTDEVTMSSGVYDPDHAPGGQALTAYASPFTNQLPNISAAGSLALDGTAFGFNATIGGYSTENETQNTAHEFEVSYSTNSGVSFSDDAFSQRLITSDRLVSINSNAPANYYVRVRALQNKQTVSTELFSSVVAGGGGVPPGDQILVQLPMNLTVISGTIDTTTTSGVVDFTPYIDNVEVDLATHEMTGEV